MTNEREVARLTLRVVDAVHDMEAPIELKVAALKSAAAVLENSIAATATTILMKNLLKQ